MNYLNGEDLGNVIDNDLSSQREIVSSTVQCKQAITNKLDRLNHFHNSLNDHVEERTDHCSAPLKNQSLLLETKQFQLKNDVIERSSSTVSFVNLATKKKHLDHTIIESPLMNKTSNIADIQDNKRSTELPVWSQAECILDSIKKHRVTLIVGETGSGKTTQIPQIILHHMNELYLKKSIKYPPMIAITQPRRIAAITLATRVSDEIKKRKLIKTTYLSSVNKEHHNDCNTKEILGGIVGYSVRFQQQISKYTQIKFLTDGMLLRESLVDPLLKRYKIIILDEIHERSLRTDILLGLMKYLLTKRSDLRIILMSATLDYQCFKSFFQQGHVILIPGRQYPVTTYYSSYSIEDSLQALIDVLFQLHLSKEGTGDILAFLPGQEEIEAASILLEEKNKILFQLRSEFVQWCKVFSSLQQIKSSVIWKLFIFEDWDHLITETTENSNETILVNHNIPDSFKQFIVSFNPSDIKILKQIKIQLKMILESELQQYSDHSKTHILNLLSSKLLSQLMIESSSMLSMTTITNEDNTHNRLTQIFLSSNPKFKDHINNILILPLYAALPVERQQRVFQPPPPNTRKIILATNIAETSLTLPGVRYVVDTGFHKVKEFNPHSGVETLSLRTISRAMANQRTGRAGREGPGESYRLYTEQDYYKMAIQIEPEIQRSNLTQVVLELKMLGVNDVKQFPFISSPNSTAFEKALQTLTRLSAIDVHGIITPFGKKLAALPINPEHGYFLLNSIELGCTAEALSIVSIMNTDPIWIQSSRHSLRLNRLDSLSYSMEHQEKKKQELCHIARKKILCVYGDHLSLLNAYMMWDTTTKDRLGFCKTFGLNQKSLLKAKAIRQQLKDILLGPSVGLTTISSCLTMIDTTHSSDITNTTGLDLIRRCLVKSFPFNIARLQSNVLSHDQETNLDFGSNNYIIESSRTSVHLHPLCGLFGRPNKPQCVVFTEIVETSKLYIRQVTAVEGKWLTEYHPNLFLKQLPKQEHRDICKQSYKKPIHVSGKMTKNHHFPHKIMKQPLTPVIPKKTSWLLSALKKNN